jgi:hypothetical protein
MRALPGSFDAAMHAMDNLRAAGIRVLSNTHINRTGLKDKARPSAASSPRRRPRLPRAWNEKTGPQLPLAPPGRTEGRPATTIASPHARGHARRHFTMSVTVWLQLPSPVFVTGRYRNSTVAPGVSPGTVVFACRVAGAVAHVLPPSRLYSHS